MQDESPQMDLIEGIPALGFYPLNSTKNSTVAVQCPASTDFVQLRLNRSTTLLPAHCTYAKLRPVLLGLQRF